METAYSPEARLEAILWAAIYVQEHLVSRQSIRHGRQYALTNIRLSRVFIAQ